MSLSLEKEESRVRQFLLLLFLEDETSIVTDLLRYLIPSEYLKTNTEFLILTRNAVKKIDSNAINYTIIMTKKMTTKMLKQF